MIKFSPDSRYLYSLVFNCARCHLFLLDVNIENDDNFSLDVLRNRISYHPWEFESCSKTGFLLGDPFCLVFDEYTTLLWTPLHAFVLNEKSVLTIACDDSTIEMLQPDKLTKYIPDVSMITAVKVVLSLNGDTLFVITEIDERLLTLMAWDISSGMFSPWRRAFGDNGWFVLSPIAVREGVLLQTSGDTLELWNFELSECIHNYPCGN